MLRECIPHSEAQAAAPPLTYKLFSLQASETEDLLLKALVRGADNTERLDALMGQASCEAN